RRRDPGAARYPGRRAAAHVSPKEVEIPVVFPTAVSSSKLYLAAIKFGFIGVEGTDGYWRKKTWLQVIQRLRRG
ncbi:MAG: hypothetical protein VX664_05915, partial [Chloroflexota bacterium]|nr:hypothetical protein [Chloroflexota bacterium]